MAKFLRTLTYIFLAGSLNCYSGAIQAADTTTIDGGRFQLIAATVHAVGKESVVEIKSLLKIDTTTGQTWFFSWRTQADGVMVQEWQAIK